MNIFLNNELIKLDRSLVYINNVYYCTMLDIANLLDINKSNDVYYRDEFSSIFINNNNLIMKISDSNIVLNDNIIYDNGYIVKNYITYIPIQVIIESYNGKYIEIENGIYIII